MKRARVVIPTAGRDAGVGAFDPLRTGAVFRAVAAGLLLVAGAAAAQTTADDGDRASRPWMLGISGQIDDQDTDSLQATFNWGVTENTWIYFSGGTSHFENGFGAISTSSFLAGFDRQVGRFGFSLDGEVWGDSAEIEATDLRGTAYFGGERYRIYLEVEDRQLDLSPALADRPLLADRLMLDVDGTGVGLRARIDLTEGWRLYLRGMSYDYEWASQSLPRQDTLIDLCVSAAALIDSCQQLLNFLTLLERRNLYIQSTLANNSVVDSELSLNLEWELGAKLLNVSFTRDEGIDRARSETRSVGASLLFPIGYRMDLEVSLGRSDSDFFEPSTYGGLFFLLYGG